VSKYLMNKFLFTIDRDPELVERYRTNPRGTVEWWEAERASVILNCPEAERSTWPALTDAEREALATHDYVRNRETSARLQDPKRLSHNAVLVARQVDHAIRDDDIDRVIRQRDILNLAFEELDVGQAALALVLFGEREHFIGHVEAVGLARRADALCREQHVDAAARA
jgi:hypothetical protein